MSSKSNFTFSLLAGMLHVMLGKLTLFFLRFFEEIEGWLDVDKDKSHCFKNKQDSNWVGIRYGWAIVTFKSKRARNKYLEDEDRHFVRETENSPYEKLKVSPWFDKPKAKQPNKSEKINKIPLYKSDLEKEVNDQTYLTVEEFTRGCTDTSIQVFKGRVSSYIPSQAGQPGHVGDLEILLSHGKAELVIFHSDTVWLPDHTGTADSPVRCGVDNFLEKRLQVSFRNRPTIRFNLTNLPDYYSRCRWSS